MRTNTTTLTSANSIIMVRCKGIYDDYFKLEGFQAGQAATFGEQVIGETKVGVDVIQSIGYIGSDTQWTIHLEANSPSRRRFNNIVKTFNNQKETAFFEFIIELPSIKERMVATGGLISVSSPNIEQILGGTVYNFKVMFKGGDDI